MILSERLKKEAQLSQKAGDRVRTDALRMASSAIHYQEIEKRGPLTEVEAQAVVASLCKKRRESIAEFQKGGRMDLVEKETRELKVLQEFLPPQLPLEQVREKAKAVIANMGAASSKDRGRVMKELMQELKGQVDGSVVSQVVGELLK